MQNRLEVQMLVHDRMVMIAYCRLFPKWPHQLQLRWMMKHWLK